MTDVLGSESSGGLNWNSVLSQGTNIMGVAAAAVSPVTGLALQSLSRLLDTPTKSVAEIVNVEGVQAALGEVNKKIAEKDPNLAVYLEQAGESAVRFAQTLGIAADKVLGELRLATGRDVAANSAPLASPAVTTEAPSRGR